MENPFDKQVEYHKKEMEKWRIVSIVLGIILFLSLFI